MQEGRQGPKRCVDLNQYLCLNDWLAIYSTVMMCSLVLLQYNGIVVQKTDGVIKQRAEEIHCIRL